jgi:hypothetical protein
MRAAVDGELPGSPFVRLTGLRSTEVGFGRSTWAMPASASRETARTNDRADSLSAQPAFEIAPIYHAEHQ